VNQAEYRAQALDELRKKSFCDINRETAFKWAWRAWAARVRGRPFDAEAYRTEAVEHAALVGDDLKVLAAVRRISKNATTFAGTVEDWDQQAFDAAFEELRYKTLEDIHRETAFVWAWRAWAGYQLGFTADAVDYEAQSLEHAALSDADDVLFQVREIVKTAE